MLTGQGEPDNGPRHSFASWLVNSGQVSIPLPRTITETLHDNFTIFLQQAAAKLPWGHIMVLINKLKTENEHLLFGLQAIGHG